MKRPRAGRRLGLIPLLLIGGAILVAVVTASRLISIHAIATLRSNSERAAASSQSLVLANELELQVIDLQAAGRGFVITGDPEFLEPRDQALRLIPRLERRLLTSVPVTQRRERASLRVLFTLIDRYATVLQPRLLALARRDPRAASDLVASGAGKRKVEAMRRLFSSFIAAQSSDQARRQGAAREAAARADSLQVAGLVGVVVLVAFVLLLVTRGIATPVQRLASAARRIGEGDRDARVPESGAGQIKALTGDFNAMAASIQHGYEQLAQAATLKQTVLETAKDTYMATDESGRVVEWTPNATEMFGYEREEALGRQVEELTLPERFWPAFYSARESLIKAGAKGEGVRFEGTATHRDGRRFLVEVSSRAIPSEDGWVLSSFVRNIEEAVQRSRARRAATRVHRVLAEAGPDEELLPAITRVITEAMEWRGASHWSWDSRSEVLRCDYLWDRADRGLGSAAAKIKDRILNPAAPSSHRVVVRAFEQEEIVWGALDPSRHDDDVAQDLYSAGIRSVIALPLAGPGGVQGALHFILEKPEEPSSEVLENLQDIVEQVAQAVERRRAEREAEQLKDEFFALVSHELRTPLTSIVGYLEIVRDSVTGELNEEQERFLAIIERNAQRLLRLVGDLLFVAQVEAGTLSLEWREADLAAVTSESVEAARPRAADQGVRLSLEAEPVTLKAADGDRLGQLVDNLISNALKFTPEGGRVEVRVRRRGDSALVEVSDTGVGIAEEELDRLFDRFYRSPSATGTAVPGIGLGLSICQAIAAGHGGSIAVESELGAGTTFTLELPMDGASGELPDG